MYCPHKQPIGTYVIEGGSGVPFNVALVKNEDGTADLCLVDENSAEEHQSARSIILCGQVIDFTSVDPGTDSSLGYCLEAFVALGAIDDFRQAFDKILEVAFQMGFLFHRTKNCQKIGFFNKISDNPQLVPRLYKSLLN
jgi:hypothetical protein